MLPSRRGTALRLLHHARGDILLAREVEAICHATSSTADDYLDSIRRCAYNLHANPSLGAEVAVSPDASLLEGTLAGRIEEERLHRAMRFERMLQEKYEALDDGDFQAIVRCRKCGSTEVRWEEKQTRSADEGATVFCSCTNCKNRWVMR